MHEGQIATTSVGVILKSLFTLLSAMFAARASVHTILDVAGAFGLFLAWKRDRKKNAEVARVRRQLRGQQAAASLNHIGAQAAELIGLIGSTGTRTAGMANQLFQDLASVRGAWQDLLSASERELLDTAQDRAAFVANAMIDSGASVVQEQDAAGLRKQCGFICSVVAEIAGRLQYRDEEVTTTGAVRRFLAGIYGQFDKRS